MMLPSMNRPHGHISQAELARNRRSWGSGIRVPDDRSYLGVAQSKLILNVDGQVGVVDLVDQSGHGA
jgi:hypothetical protein